jgi:hypothetical protein
LDIYYLFCTNFTSSLFCFAGWRQGV